MCTNIDNKNYRVSVRAKDLIEIEGRGRLKQINKTCKINNEFHEISYNNLQGYARFPGCTLKAGIFYREGYGGNENKIKESTRDIGINDILGYPNKHRKYNGRLFYDLACFFTNAGFLDKTSDKEATKRYFLNFQARLYKKVSDNGFQQAVDVDRQNLNNGYYELLPEKEGGYTALKASDRGIYYIQDEDAENRLRQTNLLNWKEQFLCVDEGTDNNGDLFCDNIRSITDVIKEYLEREGEEEGAELLARAKDAYDFLKIYDKTNPAKSMSVKRALRRLVCRHPLEWDSSLYVKETFEAKLHMNGNRFDKLKTEMDMLDIWREGWEGGIKKAIGNHESNNLWFVHPVYFINHLNEAGLLDMSFNPYFEKEITAPLSDPDIETRKHNGVSNPGFTVLLESRNGTNEPFEYDGKLYAYVTSMFNVKRKDRDDGRKRANHTGIDFGLRNGEGHIVSLIHGKVWARTWHGEIGINTSGLGNVMLIKDRNADKLYVLAHLQSFKKNVNDNVEPHEVVAIAGSTGASAHPHLHLEVYTGVTDEAYQKYNIGSCQENPSNSKLPDYLYNMVKGDNIIKLVNPFNHEDTY